MSEVVELSYPECVERLQSESVGRIAVLGDPFPLIFPVNYRLVKIADEVAPGHLWIAVRTRVGNRIDRASTYVSFEIDGVDPARRSGWSVLTTGTLHAADRSAAEFEARFDSHPWLATDRDRWLVIQPVEITGRRIVGGATEWAYPGAPAA